MPAAAIVGAVAVGGGALLNYFSTQQAIDAQKKANEGAMTAQQNALQAQLDAQKSAYDQARTDLAPWREKGAQGLDLLSTLLGANGADKQAEALQNFVDDPTYQAMVQQGTEGVLKSASATGALRTGGTASAVSQVAPSILNQQLRARIAELTNLSQLGQQAAGGTVAAGQNTANQMSAAQANYGNNAANLITQQGQINSVNPFLNSAGMLLGGLTSPAGAGITDWLDSLNAPKTPALPNLTGLKR